MKIEVADKIRISFGFDPKMVERMHSLGGIWSKKRACWEFAKTRVNYERLLERGFHLPELPKQTIDLRRHAPKTKPFAHQSEAMKVLLKKFGFEVVGEEA